MLNLRNEKMRNTYGTSLIYVSYDCTTKSSHYFNQKKAFIHFRITKMESLLKTRKISTRSMFTQGRTNNFDFDSEFGALESSPFFLHSLSHIVVQPDGNPFEPIPIAEDQQRLSVVSCHHENLVQRIGKAAYLDDQQENSFCPSTCTNNSLLLTLLLAKRSASQHLSSLRRSMKVDTQAVTSKPLPSPIDHCSDSPLRVSSSEDDLIASSQEEEGSSTGNNRKHRSGGAGRWQLRLEELEEFGKEHGHCCVPSNWPENPSLAQWVKRQRYQHKLKTEGKHSNLTDEREAALNKQGFVWDSHAIFWDERLSELCAFRDKHGHCNVPTKYPDNQPLAVWAKCQRRQFSLFFQGDHRSNMTLERASKLVLAGFVLNPRQQQKRTKHSRLATRRTTKLEV
jgi:hypothetical protein